MAKKPTKKNKPTSTPNNETVNEAPKTEQARDDAQAEELIKGVEPFDFASAEKTENADSEEPKVAEPSIDELIQALGKAKEDVLRAQADSINARRRSETEVEKARKFALERFVADLLPVVDNFERALSALDQDNETLKPLIEGVELTQKTLIDALEKNYLKAVDPEGEPFDPECHQAVSMVPNAEVEPNTVLQVFQKGYILNGRLIRPAMVVVSQQNG